MAHHSLLLIFFFIGFSSFSHSFFSSSHLILSMSSPVDIRVPQNTHPSRLPNYGTVENSADLEDQVIEGYPLSRPQSFRDAIESFAGSYSRASLYYFAENLTVPSNASTMSMISPLPSRLITDHNDDVEHQRHSEDSKMRHASCNCCCTT